MVDLEGIPRLVERFNKTKGQLQQARMYWGYWKRRAKNAERREKYLRQKLEKPYEKA